MALGTNHLSATTLAAEIPEKWGARLNDFYRSNLVMANFFTDRSDEVVDGGDIIRTPSLTEMTANAKAAATQVTLNNPTEATITLTVNQHFEVSFLIEDKEAAQVKKSYNVQERYAKNAAFTTAKKLEVAIATLFDGFSAEAGTTTNALTDASVLDAMSKYTTAEAPYEESAWFLHPKTVWEDLMVLDKFSLITNAGGEGPVKGGAIGMLYGRPVFQSTNLVKINTNADYAGALANPDAIHWATAALPGARDNGVRLQASYIQEYLGTLVTADVLYGVIENRDAAGVQITSAV